VRILCASVRPQFPGEDERPVAHLTNVDFSHSFNCVRPVAIFSLGPLAFYVIGRAATDRFAVRAAARLRNFFVLFCQTPGAA